MQAANVIDLKEHSFNDSGNAQLIAEYLKYSFVYDADMCRNRYYDGKRWVEDKENLIMQEAIKALKDKELKMSAIADNDLRGKRVLFYINSQNFSRINSALKILQTIPGIVVRNSVFDRNDTLFNVQNCTIDLTTKTVRPHNKDDYITRISPVNYDPSADCPIFKNFLKEIFDGNINLISHEQRKLGYFLSGLTSEQKLFINFGSGCNGKSTLQEIFRSLMGDYAVNIPIEALMAKDMPGINNDIVRLRFARLATTGEVEIGKKLAESQTKLLTGGDVITARALYSEPIEFKNKAKIIMGTNHLPGVRGQEYGIFRRFDITPFNVTIPKEKIDRSLFNKLLKELPGILNWALDGFLEWQKYGLGEHEEIKQAVENYRISQDPIANFINECCVVGKSDYKIAAQELYKHYEEWCKDCNEFALSQRKFGTALGERGYKKWNSTGNKIHYAGIDLKNTDSEGIETKVETNYWDALEGA